MQLPQGRQASTTTRRICWNRSPRRLPSTRNGNCLRVISTCRFRERFANDIVVLLVYDAFQDKMKPVDIQSCLDITENEYNAAAKRLRRAVRGFATGRPR